MTRPLAVVPEIVRGLHEPGAEMALPDAIHGDAGVNGWRGSVIQRASSVRGVAMSAGSSGRSSLTSTVGGSARRDRPCDPSRRA